MYAFVVRPEFEPAATSSWVINAAVRSIKLRHPRQRLRPVTSY
jgi:hypothetical protein